MANQEHKLCPTYPSEILVPASISDSVLEKVAQFRSARRIPAIVWRNTANGAVMARCSQPEVGWLGWRSSEDEELVRAIAEACAYDSGELSYFQPEVRGGISRRGSISIFQKMSALKLLKRDIIIL